MSHQQDQATQNIQDFCENLKKTLLDAHSKGFPIVFARKDEKRLYEEGDGYAPLDYVQPWTGCQIIASIGGPALKVDFDLAVKKELIKFNLLKDTPREHVKDLVNNLNRWLLENDKT